MSRKTKKEAQKKITKKTALKKATITRVPKKRSLIRKKIKEPKKKQVNQALSLSHKFEFLANLLDKMVVTKNHYDIRSEIILGISALIFIFSLGAILNPSQKGIIGFIIIALASLGASVLSLYSVVTPYFFQDTRTAKSIMHHGYLAQFSQSVAIKKLNTIIENPEKIIEQYTREIYNIARNSIIVKKKFNKRAVITLIWGLVIGFILIIFLP